MRAYPPMATRLVTDRLILQPWTGSLAGRLRALHAERGDGTPTIERAQQIIGDQLTATRDTGIALLPVHRRAEGDFIGYCGLTIGRATVDEPEIAYELFRHSHGSGYATEAARAVLAAAAATGRVRLWSTVRTWNGPSLRVLDKLGFHRDHITVDDRGELIWLTRTLP